MKWYNYILCFLLIFCGAFFGLRFYQELKSESYINGSIDITNKFSQESFSYCSTSIAFTHDIYDTTETYLYENTLLPVDDFNGKKYDYVIKFNGYELLDCEITAGYIKDDIRIEFFDVNDSLVCDATLKMEITFLSDKTLLKIGCVGNQQASFLEEYFEENGFKIEVIEKLEDK